MSEIRINILDRDREVSGEVHGSVGEAIIAALSAEPETIDELAFAYLRFVTLDHDFSPFTYFHKHTNFEPHDAGIVIIDLAGRTIGYESTYSYPASQGIIPLRVEGEDGPLPIRFQLPDDWLFINCIPQFEGTAAKRREERLADIPMDYRSVLYGKPMVEFILAEVKANATSTSDELFTEIHAKWLMSARDDLGGKTPREVMFEKRRWIETDISSRELQWSFTKICPPPLLEDSHAYKFAGFGTHEIVTHYDLFRHLLEKAWSMRGEGVGLTVEELKGFMAEWMESPEEFRQTPREIISYERRRIPLVMMKGEEIIDEDCPTCIGLSELLDTPGFWHIDGCNMDYRFEFSLCETREEWEEEQRSYDEYTSDFTEEYGELDSDVIASEDEEPF